MKLGIAGSTGNVGKQTLQVIDDLQKMGHDYEIIWLGCHGNIDEIENQINKYKPQFVSVIDMEKADELRARTDIPIYSGKDGLSELIKLDSYDGFVNTIMGTAGLEPTVDAIKNKKTIYLANKETLVAAGPLIMDLAREYIPNPNDPSGTRIIPFDDEPAAIHDCLRGRNKKSIAKITITCSGGALHDLSREEIKNAPLEKVLKHPTFVMSPGITINSGTLMNKGHEVIQAAYYFDVPLDKIDVLVHPGSYISSGIRNVQGRNFVEICPSDVKYHIHYALTYPDDTVEINFDGKKADGVDLLELESLKLAHEPDVEKFPCFKYALDSYRTGGTMPCAVNAANEIAIDYFYNGKIKRVEEIENAVRHTLYTHKHIENPTLKEIIETDKKIREETRKYLDEKNEPSK